MGGHTQTSTVTASSNADLSIATVSNVAGAATTGNIMWLSNGGSVFNMEPKPVARPQSAKLLRQDIAPPSYIELAKAAGAMGSAEVANLEARLQSLNLPVFDVADVSLYMTYQAGKLGMSWGWKPLRDGDVALVRQAIDLHDGGLSLEGRAYTRAIPSDVLETVKAVTAELPKAVFLVSDYGDRRPDPFLAVTTERMLMDGRIWIIAEWDEPGFYRKPATVTNLSTKATPGVRTAAPRVEQAATRP